MRLLVCGSREWPGTWEDIGGHFPENTDVTIIHGACSRVVMVRGMRVERSVDMLADFAAWGLGHGIERYPVDHAIDGPWPGAGPRRNARMLREGKPDAGLSFGALWRWVPPTSAVLADPYKHTGTGGMVSLLLRAGLPVRWVATPDAVAVDLREMPEAGR